MIIRVVAIGATAQAALAGISLGSGASPVLSRDEPAMLIWDSTAKKCLDEVTGRYVATNLCLAPGAIDRLTTQIEAAPSPYMRAATDKVHDHFGGLTQSVPVGGGVTPAMVATAAFDECLTQHGSLARCVSAGHAAERAGNVHDGGATCERVHVRGEKYDFVSPRLKSGTAFFYGCGEGWGGLVHVSCSSGRVSAQYFCEACSDVDTQDGCAKMPGCAFSIYFGIFTLCKFDTEHALRYEIYDTIRANHTDL